MFPYSDTSQMAATNKILNDGVQKSNEISSSSGAPIPLLGDSQTGINRSNVNVLEGFAGKHNMFFFIHDSQFINWVN